MRIRLCSVITLSFLLCTISTTPAHAHKDPKALFERGIKFAQKNNLKKAEKYFKKVTKMSFGHYPSYFNLSLISIHKKEHKKALKYLKNAKQFNPFDLRSNKMLALVNLIQKNYDESKKSLSEIITKQPANVAAHKQLGILHLHENNIQGAIGEFTLIRNLAPNDLSGSLLWSISYARNNNFAKALEIIKPHESKLTADTQQSFYAILLEKNPLKSQTDEIINDLIDSLEEMVIQESLDTLSFIDQFENPEVSKRMANKIKKEELLDSTTKSDEPKKKRPLDFTGTLVETFEQYDRTPKTSSPINGMNVKSNLKLEGKTANGIKVKGEWEGWFNRWDNNKLDFYKINATKKDDYEFEVDFGKFSAKHLPSLVSIPTVLDGVRVWKKYTLPEFKATEAYEINTDSASPVNLGEIYRKNKIDTRPFKNIELTALVGRTKERKQLDDRKEKNEYSTESSGQLEQWTQAYRIHSQVNTVFEVGATMAITQGKARDTTVSSTTYPVESIALGIDGGIDLLDNDLNIDAEIAFGNYDENTLELVSKHLRDIAWIFKAKHKIYDTVTFTYDQKVIGRNFKVEGASQTRDKFTHDLSLVYKPQKPKTWFINSQTFKFKPEMVGIDGNGDEKKRYRTFQTITDFKLPQNAKYTFDYKYYRERDKCGCTDYRTLTIKNSLDWKIDGLNTTIKPSYTLEIKDDMVDSPTDEKKNEYVFTIKNKSIKNLELDYSFEIEAKKFRGATEKSYRQYINTVETKYTFIPSRFDAKIKASQDWKEPSDTNQTDITTLTFELNYTSKDSDDKFNLKYERKNNIYLPWSDSSAYRQNYVKLKYTHKF